MMRESGFMDIPFPSEQQAEKLESLKKYIRELGSAVVAFSSGVDSTFMVDRAEQLLLDMGFHQIRVRIHGSIARIEILPFEFV